GRDHRLIVWDVAGGAERVRLQSVGERDYVIAAPSGEYTSSRGGTRGVGFRLGDRVFPFDQFDLKYNRPDRVLQRLGADPARVAASGRAYEGGRKRLGSPGDGLAGVTGLPELALAREVPPIVHEAHLHLAVRASSATAGLARLLVYVGGV